MVGFFSRRRGEEHCSLHVSLKRISYKIMIVIESKNKMIFYSTLSEFIFGTFILQYLNTFIYLFMHLYKIMRFIQMHDYLIFFIQNLYDSTFLKTWIKVCKKICKKVTYAKYAMRVTSTIYL